MTSQEILQKGKIEIDNSRFPTLKKTLYRIGALGDWKHKRMDEEQLEAVEELDMLVQFKLEELAVTSNSHAHTNTVGRYMAKHFTDWSDNKDANVETVQIIFPTANKGKNEI